DATIHSLLPVECVRKERWIESTALFRHPNEGSVCWASHHCQVLKLTDQGPLETRWGSVRRSMSVREDRGELLLCCSETVGSPRMNHRTDFSYKPTVNVRKLVYH